MGTKESYLTFIKQTTFKCKHPKGLYECICGNTKEIAIGHVNTFHTISCGCKGSRKTVGERSKTHGLSGKHPLYGVWNGMKARCYDIKAEKYLVYGGVGVTVCDLWLHDFQSFYDWCISNGWKEGLQIDKDIKGNGMLYSPETCLIVTSKENNNNRTNNCIIDCNGVSKTLAQWSEETGIKSSTINARIKIHKWSVINALTKKPDYATNTKSHKQFRILAKG